METIELKKDSFEQKETLKVFAKAILLTLALLSLFFLVTLVTLGLYLGSKINQFSQNSQVSPTALYQTIKSGLKEEVIATNNRKNILILGTDQLANRAGDPLLTDSIILVSINFNDGKISTLPLPRDLWSSNYVTKINALYSYGDQYYPGQPELFVQETVMQMTEIPIHHTLVLSLEQVSEIIDLLGGVEVDIPEGFTDNQFPRSDVDIRTETDPQVLYQTVSFESGKQILSGEKALQYIRSRKSDSDQGTDIARGQRQQLVIESLVRSLMKTDNLTNTSKMGTLYRLYLDSFSEIIPPEQAIATLKKLFPHRKNIALNGHSLSIYPEEETGVIFNPPRQQFQGQWVYDIRDEEQFKNEVRELLGIDENI